MDITALLSTQAAPQSSAKGPAPGLSSAQGKAVMPGQGGAPQAPGQAEPDFARRLKEAADKARGEGAPALAEALQDLPPQQQQALAALLDGPQGRSPAEVLEQLLEGGQQGASATLPEALLEGLSEGLAPLTDAVAQANARLTDGDGTAGLEAPLVAGLAVAGTPEGLMSARARDGEAASSGHPLDAQGRPTLAAIAERLTLIDQAGRSAEPQGSAASLGAAGQDGAQRFAAEGRGGFMQAMAAVQATPSQGAVTGETTPLVTAGVGDALTPPPGIERLGMVPGTATSATPPGTPSPATANLPAPVASPQWPQQLGQQLVGLTQRGDQQIELHLNPAELGPLSVSLKLGEHGAQAQFLSAHAQVRSVIEQAIPQLREALAEQGIALGDTSVGEQQAGEQQQGFAGRQGGTPRGALEGDEEGLPASSIELAPGALDGRVDLYA